jgi:altronate hydrolase
MAAPKFIHINEKDNAVISLFELQPNDKVEVPGCGIIEVKEKIPMSHKIAIRDFKKGDAIIKYGEVIGHANCDIPKGSWIHAHNIAGSEGFMEMLKDQLKGGS